MRRVSADSWAAGSVDERIRTRETVAADMPGVSFVGLDPGDGLGSAVAVAGSTHAGLEGVAMGDVNWTAPPHR